MRRLFIFFSLLWASQGVAKASGHSKLPPPHFRVAYVGDQGLGEESRAVVELIRDEKARLWVHLGDFDYQNDPAAWEAMLNDVLGADFPIFPVMGNHDQKAWSGYEERLGRRLNRIEGADCTGELGVKMACTYEGITFALSGVGVAGEGHESFLADALSRSTSPWKVCAWHKNQATMQVGLKLNGTGWPVYETCRAYGAMIATAHEHSYARTHLLSAFEERTLAFPEDEEGRELVLQAGRSFAFVSGLGGKSVRPQFRIGRHWAKIYTKTQGASSGVLFCDYHVDGDPLKAACFFKNVKGEVIDSFNVTSHLRRL